MPRRSRRCRLEPSDRDHDYDWIGPSQLKGQLGPVDIYSAGSAGVTSSPQVAWDGTRVYVVGGVDADQRPRSDAAMYIVSTHQWATMPAPPTPIAANPLVVWAGTRLLVIGGDGADSTVLAYEPTGQGWSTLTTAPSSGISARSPWAWNRAQLYVWPADSSTPLAYTPSSNRWEQIAAAPIAPRQQATSVWTGSTWVIWGGADNDRDYSDGAAFDPTTGRWRVLPTSPLSARKTAGVWTGSEVLIAAGYSGGNSAAGGEMALDQAAAYNPATDTWRSLASGPAHPGFQPIWTGTQLMLFAKGGASTYDPATDGWHNEPDDPYSAGAGAPIWAGNQIVIAGSFDPRSGGSTFVPAFTPTPSTSANPDTMTVLRDFLAAVERHDTDATTACLYPSPQLTVAQTVQQLDAANLRVDEANLDHDPYGAPTQGTDPITYRIPYPPTPRLFESNGSTVSGPPHQSGVFITLSRTLDGNYLVTQLGFYASS